MKRLVGTTILLAAFYGVTAQDPVRQVNKAEITFKNTTYDYGTIPEGADQKAEFHFQNTGDHPLIVSNVQSSCGCLVPEWSKEPVMPGKRGIIKARYDTNRIGRINKSLTLTSNASEPSVVLRIKGTVISRDSMLSTLSERPQIQFEKSTYNFGKITLGAWPYAEFYFKNTGTLPLKIDHVYEHHFGDEAEVPERSVQPGMWGVIKVKFRTQDVGHKKSTLTVVSNGLPFKSELIIEGDIAPTDSTIKVAKGPRITFDKTVYDFGTVPEGPVSGKIVEGDGIHGEFRFMNTGTEPLLITNTNGSMGQSVPIWSKEPVMPGEGGVVKFLFDTRKRGPIHATLTVMSNAVNMPSETLTIIGYITPATELKNRSSAKQ